VTQPSANPAEWTGHPVWGLGFRPFFLSGALASAVLMALWLGAAFGVTPLPRIDPVLWHGHEMLYGFGLAVIAGFVLTASQNWTGVRGVRGRPLQALVGLWLLGRLAMWFYPEPRIVAALVDLAAVPWLAWLLVPYLARRSQRRNQVFFAYFALLASGNALVHAELLGWLPGAGRQGLWVAVYTFLLLLVLLGGRVIPFFSRNVLPGAAIRVRPWVERLCHLTAAAMLATVWSPSPVFTSSVAGAAALAHGARWAGWFAPGVWRRPILWVLHLGYAWLVAGFALTAAAPWLGIPATQVLHAFTAGAIGVLAYGMMTRIALGHTGRPIQPAPAVTAGYVLVNLAAALRVVWPILDPARYALSLQASGTLWVLAFALFLWDYTPILLRPRSVD
jgi:uncharacterized protein involved in response to NO